MIRAFVIIMLVAGWAAAQGASVSIRGPRDAVPFARPYVMEVRVAHPRGTEVVDPIASDFSPLIVDRIDKSSTSVDGDSLVDIYSVEARAETLGNVTLGRLEVRVKGRDGVVQQVFGDPISVAVAPALREGDGFELDPVTPYVGTADRVVWWWIIIPSVGVAWFVWRLRQRDSGWKKTLHQLEAALTGHQASSDHTWSLVMACSSHVLAKETLSMTSMEWARAMTARLGSEHGELLSRVADAREATAFGNGQCHPGADDDVVALTRVMRRELETSR